MPTIVIEDMVDHVAAVPLIAAWLFKEWRPLYGHETKASVQHRIESWLARDVIPTALVALCEARVVGTVALKEYELPQFSYSPWLAGLFTVPEFRRQGIGALLVSAAETKAASLGIQRLHLYTPTSQYFYERLGWSVREHYQLPSGQVTVMSKEIGKLHQLKLQRCLDG